MIDSHILFKVYLHLPYEEIIYHCTLCHEIKNILDDQVFWKNLVYRDFGHIVASLCEDDWKYYYEICDRIEPSSIHNVKFWSDKDKWGKNKYDPIKFFKSTIIDNNIRKFNLYFKMGCNKVIRDEQYMRLIRCLYTSEDLKINFRIWFDKFLDKIEFSHLSCWQHVANDILIFLSKETGSYIDKNKPNIEDVIFLVNKSQDLPLAFIYETMGCFQNLDMYEIFSKAFPRVGEAIFISPYFRQRAILKLDCYFFSGISKFNNKNLLEQYIDKHNNNSSQKIKKREVLHMVMGCIENDRLKFLQHLKERLPSMVTSKLIIRLCKLFVTPPIRIVNFALCCSLSENNMSLKSIQDSVYSLMDVLLKSYEFIHPESRNRNKLETSISLLLDWGYTDYFNIVKVTKRITDIFYEKLKEYLSPEELILLEDL